MQVMVIGGGGREHALAWKAARSDQVRQVYVAPGNAGTAREPGVTNLPIAADDIDGLLAFAREQAVELTIVGPEVPLVAGVVDRFQAAGLACFGPRQAAARLEGSKAYAKAFFARHGIPSASYAVFEELPAAQAYLREVGTPIVIKADGLAAGKGVVVAHSEAQAQEALRQMLGEGRFGQAGSRVVIEEFIAGEEVSFIAMVDGQHILPLASSQDHKARDDGDRGPNTGGMGAYSPAPLVDEALHRRIMAEVMAPAVRGLASDGTPYVGFLYAGLMITPDGDPRVLEFNCRFGDPETQPILLRLRSDLVTLCQAAIAGELDQMAAQWDPRAALGVVMAAAGYPQDYRKGDPITGIDAAEAAGCKVFHAGTALADGKTVTNGGRVLCVTALGEHLAQARDLAYRGVAAIHFDGAFYRGDIGHRALAGQRAK